MFLGQEVHYYRVYFIYSTELSLLLNDIEKKTWQARPGQSSRTSPARTITCATTSPAPMGLKSAKENLRNMWEKWATQDLVDKDALSTGAPWPTTALGHWGRGPVQPGHDLTHFNFLPFEKVRSSDSFVIEARESNWIEKYRVLEEGGRNRIYICDLSISAEVTFVSDYISSPEDGQKTRLFGKC